ncbi:acyltransferase [Alteromonas sp. 1_MG-2023]|uniref:acyltransferase n=1 Tax=Alteromonas sp. 1_MG-2023 TaxID=3062669 RepID=UPI0026E46C52|nr:acyltransferase [Alteromonas sp. 1_MG-2023]MDO6475433.1 acyltransferase [Alteromonas sp. 1_MG-2023]
MKFLKISIKKFLIQLSNCIRDLSFSFKLRNIILRIQGCKIGNNVTIHSRTFLYEFGNLEVGNFVTINKKVLLDNRGKIKIGSNVNISHSCQLYTCGHDLSDLEAPMIKGAIELQDCVWVYPNVTFMPNITVGKGSVIYPNSVVTKDVPPGSIVGGNPAKVIKQNINELAWKIDNRIHFSL